MKLAAKVLFGLAVFSAVAVFLIFGPPKAKLQSMYLWKAKIFGNITWSEAYCARQTILRYETSEKCVRIGKEWVKEHNILFVFTPSHVYRLEKGMSGRWELKNKGPYFE